MPAGRPSPAEGSSLSPTPLPRARRLPGYGFLRRYLYRGGATDLTVDCSDDPMLPACSSAADILAAYNTWVAGFGYDGADAT